MPTGTVPWAQSGMKRARSATTSKEPSALAVASAKVTARSRSVPSSWMMKRRARPGAKPLPRAFTLVVQGPRQGERSRLGSAPTGATRPGVSAARSTVLHNKPSVKNTRHGRDITILLGPGAGRADWCARSVQGITSWARLGRGAYAGAVPPGDDLSGSGSRPPSPGRRPYAGVSSRARWPGRR